MSSPVLATFPWFLPLLRHIIEGLADALPNIANFLLAGLGVLMSFPEKAAQIEKNPFWSKAIGYICIAVAVGGFGAGMYQQNRFNSQISQLIADDDKLVKDDDGLVTNTSGLVLSTNTVVTDFGLLMPRLGALEAHVADVNLKLATAREQHDPKAIADLQSQASAAKAQVENLSKTLSLSLAPGIITALNSWADKWDADDRAWGDKYGKIPRDASRQERDSLTEAIRKGQHDMNVSYTRQVLPLITSADYLKDQLLHGSEPNAEGKKCAVIFAKVQAGDPISWNDMQHVARYMDSLVRKSATPPQSPSGLGATLR